VIRSVLIPMALLAAAVTAGAQGLPDGTVIAGPQFVSYTFGTGVAARSVSELAVPFAVIIPFGSRLTFDLSSSYANVEVKAGGARTSTINGLTDTQLRGNIAMGDNTVFTLGLNLPTGQYAVPSGEQEAAGQIANDFLLYPVASMGTGLGATGGIAFAQPLGSWNLGIGGSVRHSASFDAFQVVTSELHFAPGDEYRLRVGLDRPVGDGALALGVTYSKFGPDTADSTTFATGDRALAQGSLALPTSAGDVTISGWDLYRAAGQMIGDRAPPENVSSINVAVGFHAGGLYIQPSAEERFWQVDGIKAGTLGMLGMRLRFAVGGVSVNPSASYVVGKLYSAQDGTRTDVTGFKGMILVRLR
jgi:hypothetical protein